MKFTAFAALAALGVAVSGCATSGPTYSALHASEPAVAADTARIYFYRPSSMMGAAIQPAIRIDGIKVGDAVPGGYFYVDKPPGTYEISATTEEKERISMTVKAGETRYVRFDIGMGLLVGHVTPTLVWPDQGASDIASLHYIGTQQNK